MTTSPRWAGAPSSAMSATARSRTPGNPPGSATLPNLMARVLSGIQPTGDFHLGNYIGAVRHWVADQDVNDSFFMIVDLHSISVQFPDDLARRTLELAAILLVAGIDPNKSTLFVQSHVSEHSELTWVLNCLATMGELRRMTQFKEKAKGGQEGTASVG